MQVDVVILIGIYVAIVAWGIAAGCIISVIMKEPTKPHFTLMAALACLALLGLLGMWAYMRYLF